MSFDLNETNQLSGFNDPEKVDPWLIVPVFDELFPFYYLPEPRREFLRFGIDHTDKYEKFKAKGRLSNPRMSVSPDNLPRLLGTAISQDFQIETEEDIAQLPMNRVKESSDLESEI
ncbi:sodium-coupled monocarboxylate transporter 2 [Plakobranchus ocellatus]|uniref:Sodium-coupled monocarboxylate transporter 2 n=1 Tax=Plakobranchus ocellatus TaxID=259542 RepID=A0AAV4C2I6_9GAST|nr:sodium-coupled monocarboxylate transporter 2 [Plakobranchus ocellatus]